MASLPATIPPDNTGFRLLILCLAIIALPTLFELARQVWPLDIGAHGPIVLIAGGWLVWRAWPEMAAQAQPPSLPLAAALAGPLAALYAFGRAYDFISLEAAALYGQFIVVLYYRFGVTALISHPFPLIFLGFLVPPPGFLLELLTLPLRALVSHWATGLLGALSYPIVNSGVAITIGPYELLVEDACAGMNSLVGLAAIALLYIHLQGRASLRYAVLLALLILPLAVAVNLLRVIVLVLLTWHAGDGVAQGFLHVTAGALLFVVALAAMFGIDRLLRLVLPGRFVWRQP